MKQLSLAAGLAPPSPDAAVYTDDDILIFEGFGERAALFGAAPVLRFIRTVGSAVARVAEIAWRPERFTPPLRFW